MSTGEELLTRLSAVVAEIGVAVDRVYAGDEWVDVATEELERAFDGSDNDSAQNSLAHIENASTALQDAITLLVTARGNVEAYVADVSGSGGGTAAATEGPTDQRIREAKERGARREAVVARLTGGRVTAAYPGGPGETVTVRPHGTTDIDVIGGDGALTAVGGPAKGKNVKRLRDKLRILRLVAEQRGVRAQAYFDEGTPQSVLRAASRILGADNVKSFSSRWD